MITRRRVLGGGLAVAGALSTVTLPAQAAAATQWPDSLWRSLASRMKGRVVRPGDPEYLDLALQHFLQYAKQSPQAIAVCSSSEDVAECIRFVRENGIPFAIRNGGHGYRGYSTTTGLQIDVLDIKAVDVNKSNGVVKLGAGNRLGQMSGALVPQNLMVASGRCPPVGIAGYLLGGGIGMYGRKYGLGSDNLIETEIVTATGDILTCNASSNADLFWALRGGGGGNFGVSTSFTVQAFETNNPVTVFKFSWRKLDSAAVFLAASQTVETGPLELSGAITIAPTSPMSSVHESIPEVTIIGHYFGPSDHVRQIFQSTLAKYRPAEELIADMSFAQAHDFLASGISVTGYQQTKLIFIRGIKPDVAREIVDSVAKWPGTSSPDAGLNYMVWGGSYNRLAPSDTAFMHRNATGLAYFTTAWASGDGQQVIDENLAWLDQSWRKLRKHSLPQAYQNFADPTMPDWQHLYYGQNLSRLSQVKSKYDPTNLFAFPMGIPVNA